jgi:hypothetical protein
MLTLPENLMCFLTGPHDNIQLKIKTIEERKHIKSVFIENQNIFPRLTIRSVRPVATIVHRN